MTIENEELLDSSLELDVKDVQPEVEHVEDKKHEDVKTESVKTDDLSLKGYKSYDQWVADGRDPDEYKGAKAFKKDGELYESLIKNQKELKQLREAVVELHKVNKTIAEKSYEQARDEILAKQADAASIGDAKTVTELSNKLIDLDKTKPNININLDQEVDQKDDLEVAVNEFQHRNQWFNAPTSDVDYAKKAYAHEIDNKIRMSMPHLTPRQHLDLVEKKINERFNTIQTSTVKTVPKVTISDSGVSGDDSGESHIMQKLPDVHKNIIRHIKRSDPNFSTKDLKEYYERLKRSGEVK